MHGFRLAAVTALLTFGSAGFPAPAHANDWDADDVVVIEIVLNSGATGRVWGASTANQLASAQCQGFGGLATSALEVRWGRQYIKIGNPPGLPVTVTIGTEVKVGANANIPGTNASADATSDAKNVTFNNQSAPTSFQIVSAPPNAQAQESHSAETQGTLNASTMVEVRLKTRGSVGSNGGDASMQAKATSAWSTPP